MEIDLERTGGIAAVVTALLGVAGLIARYGWRRAMRALMRTAAEEFAIMLAAALKQQRIRDARDAKRGRGPRVPEFVDPETTDIHELVELERKDRRAKRDSDEQQQQRERGRGERAPRPGTHHDREE